MSGNNSLLGSLATIIGLVLTIYMWMIIIRVIISWVNPNPRNQVVQFLSRMTDPALYHVRRLVPLSYGRIDFSPIILILLLVFANDFIVTSLKGLAQGMPFTGVLPIFIISLIRMVQGVLFAFMILVIARAVLSWISPDPYNMIVQFIYGITEPVMYPLRRNLPLVFGGIDLTPIILIAAIYFANSLLDRLGGMVARGLL
jgi:YggT family protein